jgi:hypothetical protein
MASETEARETPKKLILAIPAYQDGQTFADAAGILGYEVSRPRTREELLNYSKNCHSHCIMTSDYDSQDPSDINILEEVRMHFKGHLLVLTNSHEARDFAERQGLPFVRDRKELWSKLRAFLSS